MSVDEGIELILYAQEQKQEEILMQRWISAFQHIPFSEFKANLISRQSYDLRNEEEILEDVEQILSLER